jgi:hypothetical protein
MEEVVDLVGEGKMIKNLLDSLNVKGSCGVTNSESFGYKTAIKDFPRFQPHK